LIRTRARDAPHEGRPGSAVRRLEAQVHAVISRALLRQNRAAAAAQIAAAKTEVLVDAADSRDGCVCKRQLSDD
jgi:hypothetical protein